MIMQFLFSFDQLHITVGVTHFKLSTTLVKFVSLIANKRWQNVDSKLNNPI